MIALHEKKPVGSKKAVVFSGCDKSEFERAHKLLDIFRVKHACVSMSQKSGGGIKTSDELLSNISYMIYVAEKDAARALEILDPSLR